MNSDYIEEHNTFFKRPHKGMKSHLKSFFYKGKGLRYNDEYICVDEGAAVNLIPHFLLKKFGKYATDLRPHNMVLSDYEVKTGQTMGVIQVDVIMRSITRPNIFMVIASKASYNMLLGREWIHGVRVVHSSLHQRIAIWRNNRIVENV